MKFFGITDKGKVRKDNQDNFAILENKKQHAIIAVLCDGMGGQKSGGVASEISKRAFSEYINAKLSSRIVNNPDIKEVLFSACEEANGVSYEYSRFDEQFNGMGTTLVGGVVSRNGHIRLVNVGDSRAYILSRKKMTIKQITTDNSLVQELIQKGIISEEQAKHHPQKNIITKAIGTESSVIPDYYETNLNKGDSLLLCSDGLSNCVSDEEILQAYLDYQNPEDLCRELIRITFENGATDNVTVISVGNE